MKRYSYILFDLDGTLMDTSIGILHATDYIIEEFRLPEISEEKKRAFIGPPIQKSFQECYDVSQERAWEIATVWRDVYRDIFLFEATPYKGVYELLEKLRTEGIKTCIATNKREDYARRLLDHFSLLPLFDCVVGSDFQGKRNKSSIIRLCMERVGIMDPAQCLMVGDTTGDMTAAQECRVDFLGVTYGFGFCADSKVFGVQMASNCKELEQMLCG